MEEESSLGINSQELTAILQALVFEEANRIQEEAEVIFGALQQQATEREEREATQNKLDLISLDQVVELATKHGLDSDIAKTLFRTTVEARNRRERLERTVIEAQEERVASLGIGSHEFRGDWLIEEQLKQILSTSSDVVTRMQKEIRSGRSPYSSSFITIPSTTESTIPLSKQLFTFRSKVPSSSTKLVTSRPVLTTNSSLSPVRTLLMKFFEMIKIVVAEILEFGSQSLAMQRTPLAPKELPPQQLVIASPSLFSWITERYNEGFGVLVIPTASAFTLGTSGIGANKLPRSDWLVLSFEHTVALSVQLYDGTDLTMLRSHCFDLSDILLEPFGS